MKLLLDDALEVRFSEVGRLAPPCGSTDVQVLSNSTHIQGVGGAGARTCAGEHGVGHWEEPAHEPVQPVHNEEGVERGEGLGVRHDEGDSRHDDSEHAARAQLSARDGDTQDVRAVRREDDAVSRDQEDGIRDGVLGGQARLHHEDVHWS
jgi:hypothetical protein